MSERQLITPATSGAETIDALKLSLHDARDVVNLLSARLQLALYLGGALPPDMRAEIRRALAIAREWRDRSKAGPKPE